MTSPIAVIGGGPAAISAVLWLEHFGHSPLWFCDETIGGTLHKVFNPIRELPPQTFENGDQLTTSLRAFVKTLTTSPVVRKIAEVRLDSGLKVVDDAHKTWPVSAVILASGTTYRNLQLPNEHTLEGHLLFRSCSRYKNDFVGKDVLVVGGGDAAFEGAVLLHEGGARPTLAMRSVPRAREHFVSQANDASLPSLTFTRLIAIEAHPDGCKVGLDVAGDLQSRVFAAVFVRIGVTPQTPDLPEISRDEEGYLNVDSGMATSVPGIFAAGDVRSTPLRSVVTAMGDGALAAASAYASITSKTC